MIQIQDYLDTQALHLNAEDVAVSRAIIQSIIEQGVVHLELEAWQKVCFPAKWFTQEHLFKALFMALDSQYTRTPVQSVAIYGVLTDERQVVCLMSQGVEIESHFDLNTYNIEHYLVARVLESGWANIVDDVAQWLRRGEVLGEHYQRAHYLCALPICGEEGKVYGVVQLENQTVLSDDDLAQWVGFTLGILPLICQLYNE